METEKIKLSGTFLFMLTAVAGIAIFITAWNSFLQGKGKFLLSFIFLVLCLIDLLLLFFLFIRLLSTIKNNNPSADPVIDGLTSDTGTKIEELNGNKEFYIDLLKGAFSKPDVRNIAEIILKNLAQEFEIVQGVFFTGNRKTDTFTPAATYACVFDKLPSDFKAGEGITGQAVADNKIIIIPNLPESYSSVISGLGKGKARFLYIIPLVHQNKSIAVIEISCFKEIEETRILILNKLMRDGGHKLGSFLYPEKK